MSAKWDEQKLANIHASGGLGPTCSRYIKECHDSIEELERRLSYYECEGMCMGELCSPESGCQIPGRSPTAS